MKIEDFDNDEPIHHFEGKDLLHSCPSKSPFAQTGNSSPIINISPLATISPPGMTLVLEQQMLEQGKQPYRVQYNLIIVNYGDLTIEGTMVNTMVIYNRS